MADQENDVNAVPGAPAGDAEDTKTRKTVRLRPSAVTPSAIKLPSAPIADPLTGRDTDTGNLEILDDTQTRRTVKLKPISPHSVVNQPIKLQAAEAPASPVAAPVSDGQNTQTRKTVVLRPSAVTPASVKVAAPVGAPSAAPVAVPVGDGQNTQTRKTVVLRPSAVTPASVKVAAPVGAPVALPVAVAPVGDGQNTQTRKTVVLRPSAVTPASVKVAAPAAPPVAAVPVVPVVAAAPAESDGDDTQTRKTVTLRPSEVTPASVDVDAADDKTVRLQRPARPAVRPPAAPTAAPALDLKKKTMTPASEALADSGDNAGKETITLSADQVAEAVSAQPVKQTIELDASALADAAGEKATVKLPAPKRPTTPPVPGKATVPPPPPGKATTPPPPPVRKTEEVAVADVTAAALPETETVPAVEPAAAPVAARPSVSYLIMAAITLLMVAASATLTTVQYLNLYEGQNIQLPGLARK